MSFGLKKSKCLGTTEMALNGHRAGHWSLQALVLVLGLITTALVLVIPAATHAASEPPKIVFKLLGQSGATDTRKNPRNFDRDAMTIDEIIRMEEDEGYAQWKRDEARQEEIRQKAAASVTAEREAYERELEKARQEYLVVREKLKGIERKREIERRKDFYVHMARKRARREEHEKARAQFAIQAAVQRQRSEERHIARLQKVYGGDRLPASALEPEIPKYPDLAPKKPQHQIK